MATLEEDFTFPAPGGGSPPLFVGALPLWQPNSPPPAAAHRDLENLKPNPSLEIEKEERKKEKICNSGKDEEDRMDVLWENLNFEGSRNRDDCSSQGKLVSMSCGKTLRVSRAGGVMFPGKKPIVLMFIKVVKKVLRMQGSRKIKKQPW